MKKLILRMFCFLALAVAATTGMSVCVRAADNKPNIVYIVADDLGWKDVGYHGSDVKTPNIDRLTDDGARLEQFYAQPALPGEDLQLEDEQ